MPPTRPGAADGAGRADLGPGPRGCARWAARWRCPPAALNPGGLSSRRQPWVALWVKPRQMEGPPSGLTGLGSQGEAPGASTWPRPGQGRRRPCPQAPSPRRTCRPSPRRSRTRRRAGPPPPSPPASGPASSARPQGRTARSCSPWTCRPRASEARPLCPALPPGARQVRQAEARGARRDAARVLGRAAQPQPGADQPQPVRQRPAGAHRALPPLWTRQRLSGPRCAQGTLPGNWSGLAALSTLVLTQNTITGTRDARPSCCSGQACRG